MRLPPCCHISPNEAGRRGVSGAKRSRPPEGSSCQETITNLIMRPSRTLPSTMAGGGWRPGSGGGGHDGQPNRHRGSLTAGESKKRKEKKKSYLRHKGCST
ncbi:hypothetical protein E2C01_067890 [Portunus trituberculatus]|uniref:Uncharacterized protein n=1 Tax=Portunus trituberculatus TaxID=210409 RepID=A0A5B7HWD6_PORTR|nr:hypothetical protein [Portunus trituberculatus]